MKTSKYILSGFLAILIASSCNKEKKMMDRLEANWNIESSLITYHYPDGSETIIDDLSNAGKLVISQGPNETTKLYDLIHIDSNNDTIRGSGDLVTDEYRNRMIMINGYEDSTGKRNIVWTIEKEKRNKQVWSTYGVDSTLFYPSNNNNPGAASNWVSWTITLKRE